MHDYGGALRRKADKKGTGMAMTSIRLTIAIATAIATLLVPATTVVGTESSSQRVGLVAGPTYGVGLSYGRQNPSTGIDWQISAFPLWLEEDRLLYGGVTFFRNLQRGGEAGLFRLFLSGGFAAYYSWHEDYWEDDENLTLVFGPGVGLGLRLGPFDVSAGLPIAMILSNDKSRDRTRFEIIPYVPNLGCYYRW